MGGPGMDWVDYAFVLAAYVVASGIKGLTGIGFSTSCLPIMALRLDLKIAIPLVIVPSIVSNLVVMLLSGQLTGRLAVFGNDGKQKPVHCRHPVIVEL